MGHEIDLEGHRLRFVPVRRSRARSRCNSRSMVATLMDLAERPSAATGLHPGGVQIPPRRRKRRDGDPRRPISPTTAVFWLARPGCAWCSAAHRPPRIGGEHGGARRSARPACRRRCLAGIQPQQMVAQAAGELALEGNRTQRRVLLLRGRRWSSIRAGVLRLSEEQLAAVRRQGGSAPFSAQRPSAGVRRRPPRRGSHADVAVAEVFHISTGSITPLPAPHPPLPPPLFRVDIWLRHPIHYVWMFG